MGSIITDPHIDPADNARRKRDARQAGVSKEQFVRHPIREPRTSAECHPQPSEAFARHFGVEHGVDLPLPHRSGHGYRPVSFSGEELG